MSQLVYSLEVFKDKALAAGESAESIVFEVNSMRPLGQFASQLIITGNGEIDVELYTSINGDDFVNYDWLFEDQEATAGLIENHSFAVCKKFKIVITEKSGTDSVVVSHWIGVQ